MAAIVAGFALKKQGGKLAHLNVRTEKHGEEDVLAVDVKIISDVPNTFLDQLSPGLRAALYAKEGEVSGTTADIEEDHLAVLRFPGLGPLKWSANLVAAKFTVHGAKKADDQDFEADVGDLKLECKEGGTVELTFQGSVLPTPAQCGHLTELLGAKVKVSVEPVQQPDLPPLEG